MVKGKTKVCDYIERSSIILSALLAAILTPTTDAISMMLMFVPIVVFYELGILVAWMFGKKKKEENIEDDSFN